VVALQAKPRITIEAPFREKQPRGWVDVHSYKIVVIRTKKEKNAM